MILVLLAAGVVTGTAAALTVLLAGQGLLLALLAYALCGALGLAVAALVLMPRDAAAARPAGATGGREGFAAALGDSRA